jgi:D-cysteine desulfhydrase
MNDAARRVADRIGVEATSRPLQLGVVATYGRALLARLRGARWIPAGGSTPLGVLGQVNAGLELATQVRDGLVPRPDRIVLPVGTGGTIAGLALGLSIAGLDIEVVGVRVVPRVVANASHVRRLMSRTARLIERLTSERLRRPNRDAVRIVHEFYGGAYGRPTDAGGAVAMRCVEQTGIEIDPTYGAKALAAAVSLAARHGGTTLFWLSFDGRWLRNAEAAGASSDIVALT